MPGLTGSRLTKTFAQRVMSVGMERLELSHHCWYQILILACLHSTTPPWIQDLFISKRPRKPWRKTCKIRNRSTSVTPFNNLVDGQFFIFVGGEGLEPPNPNGSGFTVRRNCHYAILPETTYSLLVFGWPVGLEPTTFGTTIRRSANWAMVTILRAAWENRTPVPSMASWYNNRYTNTANTTITGL